MQVQLVGLTEQRPADAEQVAALLETARAVRRTGSNGVNERSSRSHAVVQFVLRAESTAAEGATLGATLGKITLVDLAGSERAADTIEARSGDARVHAEGAAINQSLLSLKECIRAMEKGAHHVPFRGSKLTQVLRDSLLASLIASDERRLPPSSSRRCYATRSLRTHRRR